jgi:hypothetical protein
LYRKWAGWLRRIENEQLRDLIINRHFFKQLQECTAPHVGTYKGADISEWMVQNYVAFAATAIRRMTEGAGCHGTTMPPRAASSR